MTTRRTDRGARRSWIGGGSTVARWDAGLLGIALVCAGLGVCATLVVPRVLSGAAGSVVSAVVLWAAFLVPVMIGFARSRPRRLLSFRAVDLAYGIGFGVLLRLVQGWLEWAGSGTTGFPSFGSLGGSWWFTGLVAPALISPIVEEAFFRGVLLVCLYTLVRRVSDGRSAAIVAVLVTTGVFVFFHALSGAGAWWDVISTGFVGAVCATLVLATTRLWPAVIAHITYNGLWVALGIVGTLAGSSSAPALS